MPLSITLPSTKPAMSVEIPQDTIDQIIMPERIIIDKPRGNDSFGVGSSGNLSEYIQFSNGTLKIKNPLHRKIKNGSKIKFEFPNKNAFILFDTRAYGTFPYIPDIDNAKRLACYGDGYGSKSITVCFLKEYYSELIYNDAEEQDFLLNGTYRPMYGSVAVGNISQNDINDLKNAKYYFESYPSYMAISINSGCDNDWIYFTFKNFTSRYNVDCFTIRSILGWSNGIYDTAINRELFPNYDAPIIFKIVGEFV